MKIFRQKLEKKFGKKNWKVEVIDFAIDILVIFLFVVLIIRPFFFAPFQVRQTSMMPNIEDREYILVWKTPYLPTLGWKDYQRNDIVVFTPPTSTDNYLIKRVIGLPGETLHFEDGYVSVKNQETGEFEMLDESFLSSENYGNTCLSGAGCSDDEKAIPQEITVPADKYFVMGDNRLHSRDSRTCFISSCFSEADRFLTKDDIEGRVFVALAQTFANDSQPWEFWEKITFANARIFEDPLAED